LQSLQCASKNLTVSVFLLLFISLLSNLLPNGLRYAPAYVAGVLVGGIGYHPGALPGRDNAILSERTQSHEKRLKTRTQRHLRRTAFAEVQVSCSPTTTVLVLSQGSGARRRSRVAGLCWATLPLTKTMAHNRLRR